MHASVARSLVRSLGAAAFAALLAQIMSKRSKADTRVRVPIHLRPLTPKYILWKFYST